MKTTLTLLTALLLAPLAALHAADNPLPTAKAVWRMTADVATGKQPFALKENGPVKFEPLSAAEAAESRKRGGADTAATLTTDELFVARARRGHATPSHRRCAHALCACSI